MKRTIALILAALGCLSALCACSPAVRQPSESPETASAQAASKQSLVLLGQQTEQGFYTVGLGESTAENSLYFLDYETAENHILCSKLGCRHDSDTCEGRVPSDSLVTQIKVLPDGSIVYELRRKDPQSPNGGHTVGASILYLADGDGSDRRELAQIENLGMLLAADGDALYVIQWSEVYGESNKLLRVSLYDGCVTQQAELPVLVPGFLGTAGRYMVLYEYDGREQLQRNLADGMTEEEIQTALESKQGNSRVFLWSIDSGEQRELLSWTAEGESDGRTLLWDSGRLYWCSDSQPGALHWVTPDGQSGQRSIVWPEEIRQPPAGKTAFQLEGVVAGNLLLTVRGPWGTDTIKRYALDPASGNLREIPLQFVSGGCERPITILAQASENLLVAFAEQRQQVQTVEEGGEPVMTEKVTNRYGVLSVEDFLAGRPNYREVPQQTT